MEPKFIAMGDTTCSALQKCADRIGRHISNPLDILAIVAKIESDEYNAELMLQHLLLWAAKTERHSHEPLSGENQSLITRL